MLRPQPLSPLFPYTTLFRSHRPRDVTAEPIPHGDGHDRVIEAVAFAGQDRKSTRLNSSHGYISYAVFCLKKKKEQKLSITQYQHLLRQNPINVLQPQQCHDV